MIRLPPISTRTDTLVPSATLFRSGLNTPAPPLQRNQYRFFLPTVAFAGTSSEWINDDRKLLLQGAFGRAGIYTGTRVVGFDVADGDVGSLGAQLRWAPQWAGAASFLGTHGRILPDDFGEPVDRPEKRRVGNECGRQ